jgi:hypothetical protein
LRSIALAALVAFGLYAAVIQLRPPNVEAGQDQESDNDIAVERFLYSRAVPDAVIVGSSRAQRIPAAALGPQAVNLALASQMPLVGLTIIARSGRVPRRIYVEANGFGDPMDTSFIDAVFAEPGYTLKRFIKVLRKTYQPANVAISLLRRAARGRDAVYYPKIADPAVHQALVAQTRRILEEAPNPAVLEHNLAEMKRLAALLAVRGAEVIFFEMPIEPQLEQAVGVVAVRQAVRAAFPPDRACWNDEAAPLGLPSTDGNHLDSDTAARFGESLAATTCPPSPLAAAPPH